MSLIKRLKAPTPKKYKYIGRVTKYIATSLTSGLVAVNTVNVVLPDKFNVTTGIIIFIFTSISTYCYAQVEKS